MVKKFERMGKNYCIVNTRSVGYGELPEVFHICKVDFLYALTKRLEAVKNELQNFNVLERFQIVEDKHFEGALPDKPVNKLPLDEFQNLARNR